MGGGIRKDRGRILIMKGGGGEGEGRGIWGEQNEVE